MSEMAVIVKDLSVKLDKFHLSNINIQIPKGTILGIVGKNGAGKTTLIKTIAGIYQKERGDIVINGFNLYDDEKGYLAQIGILPDCQWLNGHFKPQRLVKIFKKVYSHFDEKYFLKQLKKLEVPLDVRIMKLSQGNQKKLGLTIVMSLKPNVLILDEPTANIDPISKREVLNMLQGYLEDENKTIIYSTHQTDELDRVADYVMCIDQGKMKFFNDKDSLIEEHSLIKVSKEEFDEIDKEAILYFKETKLGYEILTKKQSLKTQFSEYVTKPNIEDLLYYYVQKEKME